MVVEMQCNAVLFVHLWNGYFLFCDKKHAFQFCSVLFTYFCVCHVFNNRYFYRVLFKSLEMPTFIYLHVSFWFFLVSVIDPVFLFIIMYQHVSFIFPYWLFLHRYLFENINRICYDILYVHSNTMYVAL